jgi:hypothetical protein
MSAKFEIHFQEGFDGNDVSILLNDEEIQHKSMTTRMQTSLAHLQNVDANPGDVVTIVFNDEDLEDGPQYTVCLDQEKNYLVVNKLNNRIALDTTDKMPGYL